MRVGLVSDVHGDHVSLGTALARLHDLGVDQVLCAGDVIDGEPFGEECIALLRAAGAACVAGNHERWRLDGFLAEAGTGEELSKEAMAWLRALPSRLDAEVDGVRLAVIHGDREADRRGPLADWPTARLSGLLAELRADILVVGHTHDAYEVRVGDALVVNAGACCRMGQAFRHKPLPRRRLRGEAPGLRHEPQGLWLPAGPRAATYAVLDLPARRFEVFGLDGTTLMAVRRKKSV